MRSARGSMRTTGIHRRSRGVDDPLPLHQTSLTDDDKTIKRNLSWLLRLRSRRTTFYVQCVLLSLCSVLLWQLGIFSRFEAEVPGAKETNGTARRHHHGLPRLVNYFADGRGNPVVKPMNANQAYNISSRELDYPMSSDRRQKKLEDSDEYEDGLVDPFETKYCKAQYPWQLETFSTCNKLHEFDLSRSYATLVANGYWRDVWVVEEEATGNKRVLKTIRYEHDYTPRNFDRHRRDALAMERLTKYKSVVDIYGFCGNSGLAEFADEGDISDAIWPSGDESSNMTSLEKLSIATQAAMGLAAVHNFDREGRASIAHTDIAPGQFVKINGFYKLNDFNRARFLRWNPEKKEVCTYHVGNNPGKNRSPEEYAYEPQTEKVDVYSLGNTFYMLLQQEWPFEGIKSKKAHSLVKKGERPSMYKDVWHSPDPIIQALKEAMIMCHEQDPTERSSARDVEVFLKKKLEEFDPGRLKEWEKAGYPYVSSSSS